MKIALMTNNYKPVLGGVPISVERLAVGLRNLGHEVMIFAPTYAGQEAEEGVYRYRTWLQHFVGGIVLPNPFDREIERVFEREHFDVIHVHHPVLIGNTAVHLARKFGLPLVFTYHTRYEKYLSCYTGGILKFEKLMQQYLRGFLKHCDYVFAPTKGMETYLTSDCRIPDEKVGVLPTGLQEESYLSDSAACREIRKKFGAEEMPLLITVSRMAREKNLEFLLHSLARTKQLYGKPFRVLFIGEGGDREALCALAGELGLSDTVCFTGAIPNSRISTYYGAADGFVFASKTETQGIVILESFAGKTPVIALRATGVEDLVQDGENGILTGEDEEEYAVRLTCFLEQKALRERLSENAFSKALSFREEAVAQTAVHRYNEVIAAKCRQKNGVEPVTRRNERMYGKPVSYSRG